MSSVFILLLVCTCKCAVQPISMVNETLKLADLVFCVTLFKPSPLHLLHKKQPAFEHHVAVKKTSSSTCL